MSQTADEHVVVSDGFERRAERGVGRRHREAKCHERGDSRVWYGAPNTNRDHYERIEGPRVWVARTGDEACYRGTWIPQEPRIILSMFASNSGAEVGVVSNSELDGDDNSTVMAKTVQVGTEWAAGVIIVVGLAGGEVGWSGLPPVASSLAGGEVALVS